MTLALQGVARSVGAQQHIYPMDLTFESGSLNVLLGPVRAGKTSLMRLMAGLDRPSAGRIMEDGRDVTQVDVRQRGVAMVYQQFINYPNFSVRENIASPLRVAGVARAERDHRVADIAGRLGLSPLLDRLPSELSGGQQQRVALARALVRDSRLLLLDEPLVNLDYKLREDLRAEMKALFRAGDRIVVYATTEPQEALLLGGRTILLDEGRLLQAGPTLDVYRRPATLTAARLVSDPPMNFLPGAIVGHAAPGGRWVRLDGGVDIPLPASFGRLAKGRYTFGIHAAHLTLARGQSTPFGPVLPVTVELAEINGSETLIHARYHDTPVLLQETGVHPASIGDAMSFRIDPSRLYAFDTDATLASAPFLPTEAEHGAHRAA